MEKTKIDWCESTWNPVTGCYHECPYCYARGIANRFSGHGEQWNDDKLHVLDNKIYAEESETAEPYPYGFVPTLHRYSLNTKRKMAVQFLCAVWLICLVRGFLILGSKRYLLHVTKHRSITISFLPKTRQGTQIYLGRVF